jgi:hypothetical protein
LRNCFKKKKAPNDKTDDSNEEANEAQEESESNDSDDNEEYAFVTIEQDAKHSEQKSTNDGKNFLLDSGASSHMCNNFSFFKDYKESEKPIEINVAKGTNGIVYGYGQGNITIKQHNRVIHIILKEVFYVPDLDRNLISFSKRVENGGAVTFNSFGVKMTIDGN